MRYLTLLILFFITIQSFSFDQKRQKEIDSLKSVVSSKAADTSKIRSLNFLAHYYNTLDSNWAQDSALYFLDQSKALMKSSGNEGFHSYAYFRSYLIHEKLQNHEIALAELINYLKVAEEQQKYDWKADALAEIMLYFDFLEDSIKSEEYARKLISELDFLTSKKSIGDACNSLGTHYKDQGELDKALKYHLRTLDIRLELGDKRTASFSYNNIGLVYKRKKYFKEALKYYFLSLEIKEELKNIKGMAGSNINIAKVYSLMGEHRKGLPHIIKGIQLANRAGALHFERNGYRVLYEIQKERKQHFEALKALEKRLELDDIIHNKEKEAQAIELERKYESDKWRQEVKLLEKDQEIQVLELAKKEEDIAAQKNIILFFIVGSVLVLILVIFLIINRNQKARMNAKLRDRNEEIKQQKEETELQKNIVEQKNKEITDSIAYAKKVQSAILPSKQRVENLLKEHFIIYLPKDIVAGDFYWVEEVGNTVFVAAADCTGHGVPGAMVSVVCANILNTVLYDENITKPSIILDRAKELVVDYFDKSEESVKDGMDIALVALHFDQNRKVVESIEYSGANNPLIIIPENSDEEEIIEIKGTKQPIGKRINSIPFENHTISVQKGSTLYLYTDGYQDQFGGEHKGGKKLKSKNFIKLLHSYHRFEMKEQMEKHRQALARWQGDLEQVDDICVIGIRI